MAGRRRDAEECKMFVGGLTRDTTADMLRGYFSAFGPVVHSVVMTNPETQKSRGFGFVTFDHPEVVDRVLMTGAHFIDGKQIDPKPSVPKDLRPKPPQVEQPKKAFLGGLPLEMNEAELREFFSSYGVVTECYIMFDEKRMKSRGFGFVSFEDESVVDELVRQHYIDVRERRVEVKLARPRENPLAPLNSEGRVLSVETQQQRFSTAAMAAAVMRSSQPAAAAYGGDWYDYYPPAVRQPPAAAIGGGMGGWYDISTGPPMAKRARVDAPVAAPPPHYADYEVAGYGGGGGGGYPYDGYDVAGLHRGTGGGSSTTTSVVDAGRGRYLRTLEPAATTTSGGVASADAAYSSSYGSSSSNKQSGTAAAPHDPSNMTPESMNTLMQQAMQSMGGMGMNMMMPMVMSNVMTQMFMNQAQTMFQSVMKQQKPTSDQPAIGNTANSDGGTSSGGAPNNANMMEVMKNVLQTLSQQQQQQRQNDNNKSTE